MTFVHVPDETMDCIRQLAVLLDPEALQDFLRALSRTPDAPDADAIARLYAKNPRHDLSPEASLERIAAAMASSPGQASHLTARILDVSGGARAGRGPDTAALVSFARRAPVRLEPRDVLTVIATSPAPD